MEKKTDYYNENHLNNELVCEYTIQYNVGSKKKYKMRRFHNFRRNNDSEITEIKKIDKEREVYKKSQKERQRWREIERE